MASDDVSVSHALGILDQYSFQSINRAVQQFKDLADRFHESLSDIRNSQQRLCVDPPIAPLVVCSLGLDSIRGKKNFDNVESFSHVLDEDIENPRGKAYALRSRTAKKPCIAMAHQRVRKFHVEKSIERETIKPQGEVIGGPHMSHSQLATETNLRESQGESIRAIDIPHMTDIPHAIKKESRQAQGETIGSFSNMVNDDIENPRGRTKTSRSRTNKKPCIDMVPQRVTRSNAEKTMKTEAIEPQGEVIEAAEVPHMMHSQLAMKINLKESQGESIKDTIKKELKEEDQEAIGSFSHVADEHIDNSRGRAHASAIEQHGEVIAAGEVPHMMRSQLAMKINHKESQGESIKATIKEELKEEDQEAIGSFSHVANEHIDHSRGRAYASRSRTTKRPCIAMTHPRVTRSHGEKVIKTEAIEPQAEIICGMEARHMRHSQLSMKKNLQEAQQGESIGAIEIHDMMGFPHATNKEFKEAQKENIGENKTPCTMAIVTEFDESRREVMAFRETPHTIHSQTIASVSEEFQKDAIRDKENPVTVQSHVAEGSQQESRGDGNGANDTPPMMYSQKTLLVAEESLREGLQKEAIKAKETPLMVYSQGAIKTEIEELPRETIGTRETTSHVQSLKVSMVSEGSHPWPRKTPCMMNFQEAIRTDPIDLQIEVTGARETTLHMNHTQKASLVADGSQKESIEVRETPLVIKKNIEELQTETMVERKTPQIIHSQKTSLVVQGAIEDNEVRHIKNQVKDSSYKQDCIESSAEVLRISSPSRPSKALNVSHAPSNLNVSEMGFPQTLEIFSQTGCLDKSPFRKGYSTVAVKEVLRTSKTKDVHQRSYPIHHLTENGEFLCKDGAYIMSSKTNHTVRPELSSPVLSDSLQKPEKNLGTSKLNMEIQIPCLLSGKRDIPCQQVFEYGESAVSFSNRIRDFPSPVKMDRTDIMKTDLNTSGEKIVENCEHQSSLGTKDLSVNIQLDDCSTCLQIASSQLSPMALKTSDQTLTCKPDIQVSNRANRTLPSLLGKRQFPSDGFECGNSVKNRKMWYVSDSVDSQAMMVECVNTSTFRNNISEELKDALKDSLQSSPLPPKDSYPNQDNICSTPEFNATRPPSSGFRFRSLAVKDSSQNSIVKGSTQELNNAIRTPNPILQKKEIPAYEGLAHISSASNSKSRTLFSRIKTAIKTIGTKETTPRLKQSHKASLVAERSRKQSIEVRQTPLTIETKVRKLPTEAIVERKTPHILHSQKASFIVQGDIGYEDLRHITNQGKDSSHKLHSRESVAGKTSQSNLKMSEMGFPQTMEVSLQMESLKKSTGKKGYCLEVLKDVLQSDETKDAQQVSKQFSCEEGVTSSKKNHTGRLELSPLVLNDSLQQSENKFNTQKPNREMQTPCLLPGKRDVPLQQCFGCEESGVSFSSCIREFPSPVKIVCNKFMKADLNESEERIVESHDQSSLGTKHSSLYKASKLIKNRTLSAKVKSGQSVLKDYVMLTECENTSTFRKSICKDVKDIRKSTEAKDTQQLSNFSEGCSVHQLTEFEETSDLLQTKEEACGNFSDKNHTGNLQGSLLSPEDSSLHSPNISSNPDFNDERPPSSGQLLVHQDLLYNSASNHDSCLRRTFTAACLERTDAYLETYLVEIGGENIDMTRTPVKTQGQQEFEIPVDHETSRARKHIVHESPDEDQYRELSDHTAEVASLTRCGSRQSLTHATMEISLPTECINNVILRQNGDSKEIDPILFSKEVDNFHSLNGSRETGDTYKVRDVNETKDVCSLNDSKETDGIRKPRASIEPVDVNKLNDTRETGDIHKVTGFTQPNDVHKLNDLNEMKEIHRLKDLSEIENALQYKFMQEGPDNNSFQFSPLALQDLSQNSAMKHSSTLKLNDAPRIPHLVSQKEKNTAYQRVALVASPSNHKHCVDRLKNSAEMEAFRFNNEEEPLSPGSSGKLLRFNTKEETSSPMSSASNLGQDIEGFTPTDVGALKFNMLLAQGTVNSSRRKRARSPSDFSLEPFEKMKFSVNGNEELNGIKKLLEVSLPYEFRIPRTSSEKSESPYGAKSPSFSPLGILWQGKDLCFDNSQKQANGKDKVYRSHSGAFGLGSGYLDTPNFRCARSDLDYSCGMSRMQKSEMCLNTHLEEEEKEAETSDYCRSIGKTCDESDMLSEKQGCLKANKTFDYPDVIKSSHKRYNLATVTNSFLDLQHQKQAQAAVPYANGKREVKVKALEAAENAKRQEEQREYERRLRRMEGHETKGTMLECIKEMGTRKGVAEKVKRAAEVKMKIDQEKAKKQEEEKRKKEEERRKKELELADRKRKREEADKREREEKRKRVEEVQKLRKEQEERQRLELDEKENKWRMLEEKERKRKAQEEEAKRQRRMEKEKEAERRRKQEASSKVARLAGKQANRKRQEAVFLQPRIHDEDSSTSFVPQMFSEVSTESFTMISSTEWDAQSRRVLLPTRNQPTEARRVPSIPRIGSGMYPQMYGGKLSTSFDENMSHILAKQSAKENKSLCQQPKSLMAQCSTPFEQLNTLESGFQSYQISPYKSSDDEEEEEDEDDKQKRPIPSWAWKENLVPQIVSQQCIDPDDIFSSEKTCSLTEIFGTAGSKNCLNFKQRGTSGDWLSDKLTFKEEIDYKRTMGYLHH